MTDEELDQLADRVARKLGTGSPAVVIGPNGNRVLSAPSGVTTGFDWAGLWKEVGPYVFRIATVGLLALCAYLGIDTKAEVKQAQTETRENGAKIQAVHNEVKARPMYGLAPKE